jgi:hypothetical protein
MERREGAEYDFNEPLLEHALQNAKGEAVILMLFLLPGRHAGGDGDVATIAQEHAPDGVRWKLSPLLGKHPALPALLFRRHLVTFTFKSAKNIIIGTLLLLGLLPAMLSILTPSSTSSEGRLMILAGGVAAILAFVLFTFRAKFWKKF